MESIMQISRSGETACLELKSWAFSFGGEHYYAYIWFQGEKIQLEFPLTQKQADYLNKKDSSVSAMWEAGEMSKRYESERLARADAIKYFHEVLEPRGAKMMRVGGYAHAHPQEIIAFSEGYGRLALKFGELYRQGLFCRWDWSGFHNGQKLDQICAEWRKHLTQK